MFLAGVYCAKCPWKFKNSNTKFLRKNKKNGQKSKKMVKNPKNGQKSNKWSKIEKMVKNRKKGKKKWSKIEKIVKHRINCQNLNNHEKLWPSFTRLKIVP